MRLAFVVLAVVLIPLSAPAATQRPNILFIFADDHSPRTLSCYEKAYPTAHTPNIDRLAASGVRFQAAYLGAWCMPSRASLLTGLHPHSIQTMRMAGAYPGSTYDPAVCRFWPAVFRQHGYQTAQIGKWHTGTDAGWGRDWDYQRVWNRPDNPKNAGSYYGPQIIDFNGKRSKVEGYATDNYTRWACEFIRGEGRQADKPWYLWLCYGAIHGPTIPADRHKGALKDQDATPPKDILDPGSDKPAYLKKIQAWKAGPDGRVMVKGKKQSYAAWVQQVGECMISVDEGVGELLRALRESGQLENTLVVYSSDQGFANGEHGLKQKVAPYDTTYSSPFIVSMPGTVPAGRFCPQTINAPDVVVTFFSLAGIALPWKMPGRDFSPLLRDPAGACWDRPTLFMNTGQDYGADVTAAVTGKKKPAISSGVPTYAAIRYGQMKYVRYLVDREMEELYDLSADPDELTNLAVNPERRATLEKCRAMLLEELRSTGADFLEHLATPSTAR